MSRPPLRTTTTLRRRSGSWSTSTPSTVVVVGCWVVGRSWVPVIRQRATLPSRACCLPTLKVSFAHITRGWIMGGLIYEQGCNLQVWVFDWFSWFCSTTCTVTSHTTLVSSPAEPSEQTLLGGSRSDPDWVHSHVSEHGEHNRAKSDEGDQVLKVEQGGNKSAGGTGYSEAALKMMVSCLLSFG